MRLVDELRALRPQLIADAFEHAANQWHNFEEKVRRAAANGGRAVLLQPYDKTPLARAVAAAVAARAEVEGFRISRIKQEPDSMAQALGASEGVVWKVSW